MPSIQLMSAEVKEMEYSPLQSDIGGQCLTLAEALVISTLACRLDGPWFVSHSLRESQTEHFL